MRILLLIILSCYSTLSFGQFNSFKAIVESDLDRAYAFYEDQFYEEAILYYTKVNDQSILDQQSYLNLADSYLRTGQLEEAFTYYKATDDVKGINDEVSLLNYSEVLLSTGRIEDAKVKLELYESRYPGNQVIENKLAGLLVYNDYFYDSAYTIIEASPLNSEHREFGLRPYGEGRAFTSSREKDLIIQHDYRKSSESALDIYTIADSANMAPDRIKLDNHFKSNDGPFSQYNSHIVVSRSNGYSKEEDVNTLGLYFYQASDKGWELDYPFNYNNSAYSITHPAFSDSGDTLYFTSNMAGGFGGSDLYFSTNTSGSWSNPMNLGEDINTPGEENFPFHDGTHLYFSSNGHPGIGGLDINEVVASGDSLTVVNMGFPINTGYDDFSFYKIGNSGNLASNRSGGLGLDDIYEFTLLPKPPPKPKMARLDIDVLDSLNGRAIRDVKLIARKDQEVIEFNTDSTGNLIIELPENDYVFELTHDHYKNTSITVELTSNRTQLATIILTPDINLDIIAPDSIMFKFGDYKLAKTAEDQLDDIVHSMELYPVLNLVIEAHTDAKGKAGYNQWLSEKRAESAANYLLSKGIEPDRITEKGYGETNLLNQCTDDVPCSPNEHAINRRIEFILNKSTE